MQSPIDTLRCVAAYLKEDLLCNSSLAPASVVSIHLAVARKAAVTFRPVSICDFRVIAVVANRSTGSMSGLILACVHVIPGSDVCDESLFQ